MNIRIGRTIFVCLIALAVATLPAATGFAAGGGKTLEASASEMMPDCDHHHHIGPSDKTQKTTDDGACMANCALTCFGFLAPEFSDFTFSTQIGSAPQFIRASDNVSSPMGNLPFRPPRS